MRHDTPFEIICNYTKPKPFLYALEELDSQGHGEMTIAQLLRQVQDGLAIDSPLEPTP